MNYIKIAGIKHGEETDLQDILQRRNDIMLEFKAAVNSCQTYNTLLPVNLFKKGNLLLSNPRDTRVLMVFLRAAARLEGAAIFCRKRGIVRDGKQTTQSLYKLLIWPHPLPCKRVWVCCNWMVYVWTSWSVEARVFFLVLCKWCAYVLRKTQLWNFWTPQKSRMMRFIPLHEVQK